MNWTPAQVRAFFDAHWTVRKYQNFVMPADHLDVILHAAQRAPTDATAQMYSIVRLIDPAVREAVALLSNNPHISTASESFVICADVHRLGEILKAHGFEPAAIPHIAVHFATGDAVLAGQNMLIAAELLGYRGCWIGGVVNAIDQIAKELKLPAGVFPFAALTLGVPDEERQYRPRLPRDHVIHKNFYVTPNSYELEAGINEMAPITARGNWPQTLARYFAKGGSMEAREKLLKAYLEKSLGL